MSASNIVAPEIGVTTVPGLVGITDQMLAQMIADEASIADLRAQIGVLQKNVLPPGAYTPPATTAAFQYSGNALPWANATLQTRQLFGTPIQGMVGNTANTVFSFPLSVGAATGNTVIYFWTEGTPPAGYNLRSCVGTIDSNGNQVFTPTITIANYYNVGGTNEVLMTMGGVATSPLTFKLFYYVAGGYTVAVTQYVANITYDGSTSVTASAAQTASAVTSPYANPVNPQAYLCGSSSIVFCRLADAFGFGPILFDATTQTTNSCPSVGDPIKRGSYTQDSIGAGIVVDAYAETTTQDTALRLVVRISGFSDFDHTMTNTVRVPGFVVGTIYWVGCLSPALAAVFFTDGAGTRRVALVSISPTFTLGLIGVYTNGNFANYTPILTATFSALILYGILQTGGLNVFTFFPITYNPAASQPGVNDLTSTTGFNYGFGAVASAVQATLRNVIRLNANQLLLVGYGGTSSVKNVISETVLLS
jgi:hypothetical protein